VRECRDIHVHRLPITVTTHNWCWERIRLPDVLFIEDLHNTFNVMSVPSVPALSNDAGVVLLSHVLSPFRYCGWTTIGPRGTSLELAVAASTARQEGSLNQVIRPRQHRRRDPEAERV